ncbi:MAG TPA: winged helix-turn-helix domain-containing protein [Terracidiphilus sp.]|nr:winged helix-turn-helix domain-containing protein [Terracidiphilus sp.]
MTDPTSGPRPAQRYRFGVFEVDATTGELRRQGMRVKLNAQPFQVLVMLLERYLEETGKLVTRDEISRVLWPEGTFVDYEHGLNSAINRIREALGDTASNPRFVETLARRGYRFLAPVERILARAEGDSESAGALESRSSGLESSTAGDSDATALVPQSRSRTRILATEADLPKASFAVVQTLFVLFQLMYLGFYIGALANLAEIEDLLSPLPGAILVFRVVFITAAILIPARAFILCAALFRAPGFRAKFLMLWPFLLFVDELWSLSPFLLLHHINCGLALACTALLVYSPFAQRSIVLMGAGSRGVDL